jgi:drug/metabolite transporter (DMT)-like permease
VIGMRRLGRVEGEDGAGVALQATLYGNALACAVALPLALPLGNASPGDWAVVAFLGVVQISLAYFCLARAAREVSALELSMLLLLEPVLSATWAWMFHGERPGPWQAAGAATILAATSVRTFARR